ncbi:MAG: portal protein [Pseudomonadota bacterium]
MASELITELQELVDHLEGLRKPCEPRWRALSEWVLPTRGIYEGQDGTIEAKSRGKKVLNREGTRSLKVAATGLTSGMTPASLPWFKWSFSNEAQNESTGAQAWLDVVEREIGNVLRTCGFYKAIHACNLEFLTFGPLLLFQDNSATKLCRFESCTVGTWAVGLNADRELDTVCRRIKMTPHQLEQRFGRDKLSTAVCTALDERRGYDQVEIIHVVMPRHHRQAGKIDAKNMPFASYMYEAVGAEDVLSESGYVEMPYFFAANEETLDTYGSGTGDDALPDIKQLQELEKQKLIGLQKSINPPIRKPVSFKHRLNIGPGGENAVSQSESQGIGPLYEVRIDLNSVREEINTIAGRIGQTTLAAYFADMSLELRPKGMTASEYLERKRERLQFMGPSLEAYEESVLTPVIFRTFAMLDRANLLPPPPAQMGEVAIVDVSYISPLAQALRQTGAESARALMQDVMQLAQVDRNVLDKVDVDQAVDELARGIGAPGRMVRSDEEVVALRQARAEEQAKQMQAQQAMQGMQSLAQMASMSTGPDTLAGDLMGKSGQGASNE